MFHVKHSTSRPGPRRETLCTSPMSCTDVYRRPRSGRLGSARSTAEKTVDGRDPLSVNLGRVSTPALSALPVRPLTLRDLPACTSLAYDRGWSPEEHKWRLLLAAGHGVGVDAPDGRGLLGACTLTDFGPHEAPAFTAIGMMLIADRYAGRGFGRRLLEHVVQYSERVPLTLYASGSLLPLARKLGFTSAGRAASCHRPPHRSGRPPGEARAHPLSRPGRGPPRILQLDAEVFGTDRTPLIARLPAFADRFLVAEEDGELTGFAARWPEHRYRGRRPARRPRHPHRPGPDHGPGRGKHPSAPGGRRRPAHRAAGVAGRARDAGGRHQRADDPRPARPARRLDQAVRPPHRGRGLRAPGRRGNM